MPSDEYRQGHVLVQIFKKKTANKAPEVFARASITSPDLPGNKNA